jgi:SusD/RagB-like outer membrane lipoprotein
MSKATKIIFLFFSIGLLFSCKKDLDKNLSNPNGVSSAAISGAQVFPAAVDNSAKIIDETVKTNTLFEVFADMWMGYLARTNGWQEDGFTENFGLDNTYEENIWEKAYQNIFNYNFVTQNSSSTSILQGAAQVMKVYMYQFLVDTYGNIPYSQGANPGVATLPAYDSAFTIYRDFIPKLDAAIIALKASTASTDDTADIVFKGNKTKWIQFANTLKLRILIRQSTNNPDNSYLTTQIGNIVAEGDGFIPAGTDVGENPGYLNASGQQNPIWGLIGTIPSGSPVTTTYNRASSQMTNFLSSTNDPRISYFYVPNSASGYDGNQLGNNNVLNSMACLIGPGILQSPSMPSIFMSASESYFLQSEAVQKGLLISSTPASSLYQKAVEESFRYLNVPNYATAADAFIAANASGSGAPYVNFSTNPLQVIGYQKWVALFGQLNGFEAWAEYRRTGYPVNNAPSLDVSAIPNEIPKRLLYPETEITLNTANVTPEETDIYTPIFWGK